ncbi:MAG: IBR domain-containing protein [Candidatus Babeliales bacterium]|nr:IBR domain-containing protein [Candidatus Babeliales bacterium]
MKNIVKVIMALIVCQGAWASAPARSGSNALKSAQWQKQLPCEICQEDKTVQEITQLLCTHFACTQCLIGIIDSAIGSQDPTQLCCSTEGCRQQLTPEDVREITANDPGRRDALAHIMTKKALANIPEAKQCPTPNCPEVFLNDAHIALSMRCNACAHTYCSNCLKEHDVKISCDQAAKNVQKSKDNQENEEWKKNNTRPCPQCKTRIEKDGGCSHITCKNQSCKYEFCWNCAAPFINDHGPKHPSFCRIPEVVAAAQRQRITGESHVLALQQEAQAAQQIPHARRPFLQPQRIHALQEQFRLQAQLELAELQRALAESEQLARQQEQTQLQNVIAQSSEHARQLAAAAQQIEQARLQALNQQRIQARQEQIRSYRQHQLGELQRAIAASKQLTWQEQMHLPGAYDQDTQLQSAIAQSNQEARRLTEATQHIEQVRLQSLKQRIQARQEQARLQREYRIVELQNAIANSKRQEQARLHRAIPQSDEHEQQVKTIARAKQAHIAHVMRMSAQANKQAQKNGLSKS